MNCKASILSGKKKFITWYIESAAIQHCYYHPNMKTELLFFYSASYYVSILFIDNFTSTKCSYVYHKYLEMYTGKFRGII